MGNRDKMGSPEFLGPYRIGEVLGRGGMGTVFSGVHETTGEGVAVKLISPHVADEMRFRRRFHGEIETLKRLRHPNIVRLIGYGEEQGQLFYSMELVEGETLQKRIRREKRMQWLPTLDIAIQICAALKHAHDFGVIHRDLKPANLIMTKEDQVKLVDFGVAKIFGYGEHTAVGSMMGTADYMAPEQANGSGVSVRTDLYALGSVMYAMLTGRPPFTGKKITEVIDALRREKPIPLDLVNPLIPDDIVALVHDLLAKHPQDRPPTALAVMNRLKAMRAGLRHQQTLLEREASEATRPDAQADVDRGSPADTGSDRPTGPEATDHDLTNPVTDTVHSRLTARLPIDAGNTRRPASQQDQETQSSAERKNQPLEVAPKRRPLVADDDITRVSHQTADSDTSEDVDDELHEPKTHFQTIAEQERDVAGLGQGNKSSNTLSHALSITLLAGMLLVGAIVLVRAMQTPSADAIYERIIDHDRLGQLSAARSEIDRFIKLFPDDERIEEVRNYDATLRINGLVRRLQLKKKLAISPLDAYEQGFLDAMELSASNPRAAEEKLRQWLHVFEDPTLHAEDDRREMAALLKFELQRIQGAAPPSRPDSQFRDPRVRELVQRIRVSEDLTPEKRINLLAGILSLYADNPWAAPALEIAQQHLEEAQRDRLREMATQELTSPDESRAAETLSEESAPQASPPSERQEEGAAKSPPVKWTVGMSAAMVSLTIARWKQTCSVRMVAFDLQIAPPEKHHSPS